MKAAFIACEYNPFHNGHMHHINETRKAGADVVICIMSGNFVQRGSIAVAEKHLRAKTALLHGADLVIELPLKYATATASLFAEGFVRTASCTGLEGFISFGAENDIDELLQVKDLITSREFDEYLSLQQNLSVNYPTLINDFLKQKQKEAYLRVLSDANNTLGIEYLKAIDNYFPECAVFCVKRRGVSHNSDMISENFASAGYLRNCLYFDESALSDKLFACREFLPEKVLSLLEKAAFDGEFPADIKKFENCAVSRLLECDAVFFRRINNVNGGLENRIVDVIRSNSTMNDIFSEIKSKRFTHSRIRQIILSACLGITREDLDKGISYIRVLGFNEKGREALHLMKSTAKLPVIMNLSQTDKLSEDAIRDAHLDYIAGRLFNLCLPLSKKGNPEYEIPPVVL